VVGLIALALSSGCAYYNTMYNANRFFSDAEKAALRGDQGAARAAYQQSIEKAAANLERHPKSRWRDDARLLMARAYLELGDPLNARAKLMELLADHPDTERQTAAQLFLGVIAAAQGGDDRDALARLTVALDNKSTPADLRAVGLLTRARIQQRLGQWDHARADALAARQTGADAVRLPAALLDVHTAIAAGDSGQTRQAWNVLLKEPQAQRWPDSLHVLARRMAEAFSFEFARHLLAPANTAPWRAGARDSLWLLSAELALQSADTSAAITTVERLAARSSGPLADAARVRAAEWRLARVARLEELSAIRNDLLPAIAFERARTLVQALKTIDVLTERTRVTGQPLALFAAAELARDELHAHVLAARLFATYAELAPQTAWAPKALLAASSLAADSSEQLRTRAQSSPDNPYVAALYGRADPDAYQNAEERLARALQGIVKEASVAATQREATVKRAVAVIDSLRVAARNDSTRLTCGILVDSLAVSGIRADSIRAACQRGDRSRIGILLEADTLALRDSTKLRTDSLTQRRIRRDTTFQP
jgi:hypothetical protein